MESLLTCGCGRQFRAEQHLAQHQTDLRKFGKSCDTSFARSEISSRPGSVSRDAWMWTGIQGRDVVGTIDALALSSSPGSAKVSSLPGCDLICSYNWQTGGCRILFPGCAPMWKKPSLPVTLIPKGKTYGRSADRSHMPRYSFEPLFQAVGVMSPNLRFNDIDIVCNRHSLRRLLLFCSERLPQSFRVNLLLIHNTLFIERCEENAAMMIRGSSNCGFGRLFEKACTSYPAGWEASSASHAVLRYPLGDLNCVVRFEVDASYDKEGEQSNIEATEHLVADPVSPALTSQTESLSINDAGYANVEMGNTDTEIRQAGLRHQSTAAEIKSGVRLKPRGQFMPQLWFGRTPWLIRGVHSNGNFHKLDVTNVGACFTKWEEENQMKLQKLVAVLKQLRSIARDHGGGNCVAIFDKTTRPPAIKVFRASEEKLALPKDMVSKFWGP